MPVCPKSSVLLAVLWIATTTMALAQELREVPQHVTASDDAGSTARLQELQPMPSKPQWHYGGFADFGYLLDFNHPANEIFRSRGTTWHVDEVHLNMAAAYIKKDPTDQSRWGRN